MSRRISPTSFVTDGRFKKQDTRACDRTAGGECKSALIFRCGYSTLNWSSMTSLRRRIFLSTTTLTCAFTTSMTMMSTAAPSPRIETYRVIHTGTNVPEALVRVIQIHSFSDGKHRVVFAGGPCQTQSKVQMTAIVRTREHLAIKDLFFIVLSSNDITISPRWALRRANAADERSYATCKWL